MCDVVHMDEKWFFVTKNKTTYIVYDDEEVQQDNAGPHRSVTTESINNEGGIKIAVKNQPPNSPDFNVLDIGFFKLYSKSTVSKSYSIYR